MLDNLGDILFGKARNIPGRNLVVSLGSATAKVGSETEQAGIFMHELGHNLGLTHGGAISVGSPQNDKPNYLSVMNYKFISDRT
ncbi:MAG: M66 family metalloprotease [Ideonella sp.]|nr:M66 family metalloprotease [Ideonella sp.]